VTLIDTVKAPFADELLARVASIIDPARIDYIVSNHSEMDHSGALPRVMAAAPGAQVFASQAGVSALSAHRLATDVTAVKDGETLDLGGLTLSFMETKMLHWPDSMFTYLAEDGVLFSQDAFGMHLAGQQLFDDEYDPTVLYDEAADYFANILLPYSSLVLKLLDKVAAAGLAPTLIAPDHGPIWRSDIAGALGRYRRWAEQKPTMKAVLVYDTMWGSTAAMARALGEGLAAGGASVKLLPMSGSERSDVAKELLEAGALFVGSPTLNNNVFPTVMDVLTYLKGLRRRNLVGAAFGSFGWGGEAAKQVHETMEAMQIEMLADPLRLRYVPDAEGLAQCRAMGEAAAARMAERVAAG
jgi:flavorubredoxin